MNFSCIIAEKTEAMATPKKKIITSIEKLSPEVLEALKKKYPTGYADSVIKVEKPNGEAFYAVPLDLEDISYLIKVHVNIDKIESADDFPFDEMDDFSSDIFKDAGGGASTGSATASEAVSTDDADFEEPTYNDDNFDE